MCLTEAPASGHELPLSVPGTLPSDPPGPLERACHWSLAQAQFSVVLCGECPAPSPPLPHNDRGHLCHADVTATVSAHPLPGNRAQGSIGPHRPPQHPRTQPALLGAQHLPASPTPASPTPANCNRPVTAEAGAFRTMLHSVLSP